VTTSPPLVQSHWQRHDPSPQAGLDDHIDIDVAIVGGGYSGLSAAYHLKRQSPGLVIGLFEARRIADGASGVNSGQCSPRVGPSIEKQLRHLGEDETAACYRYSLQAMDEVEDLVRREGIDCELAPSVQLQVALTGRQAGHLALLGDLYGRLGLDVQWLGPESLRHHLPASPGLASALSYPAFSLNPSKLCAGLKQAVVRLGVQVFENSPVTGIRLGGSHVLQCNGKQVRARQLVVATDGAAAALGLFRTQVFPVRAFCATSPVLSPERFASVRDGDIAGFYDCRNAFNFVRFTADRRIMIGGEYCYSGASPTERAIDHHGPAQRLHQQLARFFPTLRELPFDKVWSGLLGCTLDGWPMIAPVGSFGNAWFVGGWNGHGVALATASGKTVAQCLSGQAPAPRPWIRAGGASIPAACLARPAIASYFAVQKLRDRIDHWGHRFASSPQTTSFPERKHHAARP
jgi:gamma-glutamylputrescine oxidase